MKHCVFVGIVTILIMGMMPTVNGQTPTPLPGTPLTLSCDVFTYNPGITGVELISNWLFLDRAAVMMENPETFPIEIIGLEAYFGLTSNPLWVQVEFFEIFNENYLPDVEAAGLPISELYDFLSDPIPGNPLIGLAAMDIANYPELNPPIIVNPGVKFAVALRNLMDDPDFPVPGMKITAEQDGRCPPQYWSDETNFFFNYEESGGSQWYFKEDIGLSTNFYIQVKYIPATEYRSPSMGPVGILGLLGILSVALLRRRTRQK